MADSRQLDCGASTTSGARGRGGDPSLMTVSSEQTRVAAPAPSSKSKPGSYRSPFRPVAIDEDPDASTDEGDRVRNYQVHPGTNRFFLGGRFLTSGEPLYPLLGSSTVAVLLPALFWVFNSAWLWDRFGDGGGKAVVFILLALVLVMWASMVSLTWSRVVSARVGSLKISPIAPTGPHGVLRPRHRPARPRPGSAAALRRAGVRLTLRRRRALGG